MAPLVIDVHLQPNDLDAALRADVARGLTTRPKSIPPKWFYDERGSQLFDAITRLPEYYPTRREREILTGRAEEIARLTRPDTLIELGSGTSDKTRILLDAMTREGTLERFAPFDVSEPTLREAAAAITKAYPAVAVHAVVGDFERHLDALPKGGRRVIAFLGGTIGNLDRTQRHQFLTTLHDGMAPDDALLLGTDLVKDRARMLAAYDDAAGVTAEFNANVLCVINDALHADFDPDRFAHVARWNDEQEWIEMWLRSRADHDVVIKDLDLTVHFDAGEEMRTEISAKFRRDGVEAELERAGFALTRWWTDAAGDFALSMSRSVT
jgi:L-histidine N-alpha-methyltransferase